MPILIRGSSTCPLCQRVIGEQDEVQGYPAFLPRSHRLSIASDAVMHRDCYARWPSRSEFERLFARFQAIWYGGPRKMSIPLMDRWDVAASELFTVELEALEEEFASQK